jgi:hypothetical protein
MKFISISGCVRLHKNEAQIIIALKKLDICSVNGRRDDLIEKCVNHLNRMDNGRMSKLSLQ